MPKIRILLMIDDATLGGGQMHVLLLAKYLQGANFDVEIATESKGWLVDEALELRLIVHEIAISNQVTWQSFRKVRQLFESQNFDILHTHGGTAGFWGRLVAASLAKRPTIIHTYHGLHYLNISKVGMNAIQQKLKRAIFSRVDRFLLNYTNRIICVCRSDYDKAIACGLANPDRTSIVFNGIETDKFLQPIDREIARKIFGIAPGELVFGNVGRLCEQKGHKFLLQAFAKVSGCPRLMIIGDGELRDESILLANKLNIGDRVSFLGARSDVHEFLSAIDIFVMPSLWEGQPIALLEALAIGKPCIASAVDGIPESIVDGVNGYLVNPRDVDGLARVMNFATESNLQKVSKCGFSTISQKISAKNMAIEIGNIYNLFYKDNGGS
jgi:glycosyltransferase involved in cell wall biosynthesis